MPEQQLDEIRKRLDGLFTISMEKVALNDLDPTNYPIKDDPKSLEKRLQSKFKNFPKEKRAKISAKIQTNIRDNGVERTRLLGLMSTVDLHSPVTIDKQLENMLPQLTSNQFIESLKQKRWTILKDDEQPNSLNNNPRIDFTRGDTLRPDDNKDVPMRRPGTAFSEIHGRGIDPNLVLESSIEIKYNQLGGSTGWLGNATSEEQNTPDGIGRFRHYTRGSIYWTKQTHAHAVQGGINEKWKSLGAERGFLGYPLTDETPTEDKKGSYNHFQNGSIYWTPATGANEIHGAIRDKWNSLRIRGILGYPTNDETPAADGVGRFNEFWGDTIGGG